MIVTAMLAWYDENPDILYRAVRSLEAIADRVVAADGRWNYYPGEDTDSPPEQYDAIHQAAKDAGIQSQCWRGLGMWAGQVQKRNHLLRAAQPTDWVLPLDADWELKGDRQQNRAFLHTTQADAIIVPFHTPNNPDANLQTVAATNWHAALAGNTIHEPLIYRNLPDIHITDYHWHYSATKNGHQVALWGDHHPQAARATIPALTITHWCLHRDERTIQANRQYCADRDKYAAYHGREP